MQVNFSVDDKEGRLQGIGASEAGAATGVNPWKTPFMLWEEKTRRRDPVDLSDNESVMWGSFMEHTIADFAKKKLGMNLRRTNKTYWGEGQHSFMFAHLDRLDQGNKRIIEIKNTSEWMADKYGQQGTDDLPLYYKAQGWHELACLPTYSGVDFLVLVGGRSLKQYTLNRDAELIEMLQAQELDFWMRVQEDIPPPPINKADVESRYSRAESWPIVADIQTVSNVKLLADIKARMKELKAQEETLETGIKAFMAEADTLVTASGETLATWKIGNRFSSDSLKSKEPEVYERFLENSFNQKAFQTSCPDIYKRFVVPSGARSFRLK
ncbi:MAG: YqaJ viral recombinase family protein [SAR324 cluster bacterium]|nr:YqaJ viral recombinase family protein [SAR324 cluster bacterium]